MSTGARVVPHVTCLGCGCACDDIVVTVSEGRITAADRACTVGAAWFGSGAVPAAIRVDRATVTLEQALDAAESMLRGARRPLVFLAPELTCEAQRAAVAIADSLGAMLDGASGITVRESVLASQRRGRAALTLGELRHRADTILCWATDPSARHPRLLARFVEPAGLHVPRGRAGRTIIAVDVGDAYGPRDADLRVRVDPAEEPSALAALRAMMLRNPLGDIMRDDLLRRMSRAAERLEQGAYIALLYDGESPRLRSSTTAEGLVALAQALNEHHRAGACVLRAGGNCSGAEAVLAWQTGYPVAVDFARGAPRYAADIDTASLLAGDAFDAMLIVGDARAIELPAVRRRAVIGPHASDGPAADAHVVIDTGLAGIHESGMAFRMDDLPLPVRQVLRGPLLAAAVLATLGARLARAAT